MNVLNSGTYVHKRCFLYSCIAGCRLQYQFFPSPSFLDHLLWICCAYFSTNPPKTPSKKKETEMRSWVWLCASACLQIFAILLTSLLIPMSIPQYYMLRMLEICSFLDPDLSSKMQVTFLVHLLMHFLYCSEPLINCCPVCGEILVVSDKLNTLVHLSLCFDEGIAKSSYERWISYW